MDVKVRCKDDKYTRHYKADKVLYCNNGKYRFVNVIVATSSRPSILTTLWSLRRWTWWL